jgi:hypothetical protein
MASADALMTHSGMSAVGEMYPPTTSARKITPIVFCASCRPWPRAIAAADSVWAYRKPLLAR